MSLDYKRNYKKVILRRKIISIAVVVVVFLGASFGALYLRSRNAKIPGFFGPDGTEETVPSTTETPASATSTATESVATMQASTETDTTEPTEATENAVAAAGNEPGRQVTRPHTHLYTIGVPHITPADVNREYVKVNKKVNDSYFDDALFIGDSRTEGFVLYSPLSNIHAYCSKGLSITKIYEEEIVDMGDGRTLTVMDALREQKFAKIYIMFGVNELGWPYDDLFYDQYSKVVEDIKNLQPDAIIYVENIIPISAERSAKDDIYNNENVNRFNALIEKMCNDRNVVLLDVNSALADADGNLPADASTDGVHCNVDYCEKWMDYLRKNTYKLK